MRRIFRNRGRALAASNGTALRLVSQLVLPAVMLAVLLPPVAERLGKVDVQGLGAAWRALDPLTYLLALIATGVSYLAMAGQDRAVHRHFATGVDPGRAGLAGIAAFSIGQTVGFGVLTGTLLRWRMLPELGLVTALRLSTAISLLFLWAWAVLTAAAMLCLPGRLELPGAAPALVVLLTVAGVTAVSGRGRMPNLLTLARILALVAVDCVAALVALWLLLPEGVSPGLLAPVFLLALGAGVLSGAPAGLGAFDIVLLAGLPMLDAGAVLAAALCWRVIYLVLPAGLGTILALRAPAARARVRPSRRPRCPCRRQD